MREMQYFLEKEIRFVAEWGTLEISHPADLRVAYLSDKRTKADDVVFWSSANYVARESPNALYSNAGSTWMAVLVRAKQYNVPGKPSDERSKYVRYPQNTNDAVTCTGTVTGTFERVSQSSQNQNTSIPLLTLYA
jgi:hypothetical protein